ncbi:MAG TPA: PIN domain-containing protein [Chloroflexota bacterium]
MAWLFGGQRNRLPAAVQRRISREQLGVSPFVELELEYLYEIGRARSSARSVIDELGTRLELAVVDISAAAICSAALGLTWTRDPFDRLIAAHATVANLPLVTRDVTMLRYLPLAWWAD